MGKVLQSYNPTSDTLKVTPLNMVSKFRETFEVWPTDQLSATVAPGDIVTVDGNTMGASYLVISLNPLSAGTETYVDTVDSFLMPVEIGVGAHASQQAWGQDLSIEFLDREFLQAESDKEISSITQSTTTLTVTTVQPHELVVGKRIGIRGCSDVRANYPALVIATVVSPTQFTCTAGPNATIPSLTIGEPAGAKGFVYFRPALSRSRNGASMHLENPTATLGFFYTRASAGDSLPFASGSGNALTGRQAVTIGTTASVQLAGNIPYTYSFVPTNEFRLTSFVDRVQWSDVTVDATAASTSRMVRSQVVPNPAKNYFLRLKAATYASCTVPSAQIVSAVKTASATATVTTAGPHGLATGDQVITYGARDVTNFAAVTTAATVTVTGPDTFTLTWGSSVTATSYGGFVAKVHGGCPLPGAISQSIQSITKTTLADGTHQLTVVGNTTWAGVVIGDYVNLYGVRDAVAGNLLPSDPTGAWKVANIATSTLTLVNIGSNSPVLPDFASVNCGGGVIKRTDLRVSYVRLLDFTRNRVELMPRPSGDISAAAPVSIQNTPAVTMTSTTVAGTVAVDAAIGAPVTAGMRASNANIAAMSATGDNVGWMGTMIGAGVIKPYAIPEAGWNASLSLTTTTAAAIQATAGAGIKRHLTAVQAINTGASAVDLIILDGSTERWRLTLPVNIPVAFEFPTELVTTANTALNANLSAAGTVRGNFQGYTAP